MRVLVVLRGAPRACVGRFVGQNVGQLFVGKLPPRPPLALNDCVDNFQYSSLRALARLQLILQK
jgi:hypothetical protein